MDYRRLGRSGLRLSEIGLGSWLTYGYGVADDVARNCLRKAVELGINFIDTADAYHRGGAEDFLGRELREYRRRDLVLATKCFFPMSDNVNDRGLSRKHIFESVHDSLRRLRTDYVDLYQCHRWDPDVELAEVVRAMDDLVRQGKVLYWGVSEWSAAQLREAVALCRELGAAAPVSNQPECSIAARRVETECVQQACAELGLGMVVWSPLKQGVLTGKYSGGRVPRDSRAASPQMNTFLREVAPDLAERVDRLKSIATRHELTLAQLALSWVLARPAVTSAIVGASRVEQVGENAAFRVAQLSERDRATIDELFPAASNL